MSCEITGAAESTGEAAFACVLGAEPVVLQNAVLAFFLATLLIVWLRLSWQAMGKRNSGEYDWGDFMSVFFKLLFLITVLVAVFVVIK
ncbi:MAG: hypothetical protein V7749_01155 [Cocleimonas sp.]